MTPVWKSRFYGAFVPNHRVVLHAIDATPARWRGDAGSSPLEHPTHWLISTQVLPFEDTHACLLQSLKDYLDTHGEDFESKIMLKIGLSRRPGNREVGDCYPSTPSRRRRVTKRSRRRPPRRLEQRGLLQDDARRRSCAASYISATLPYAIDAMPRRSSPRR